MKTEFYLNTIESQNRGCSKVKIIGYAPAHKPYVTIEIDDYNYYIPDKDLERFAVNILKALGSKKLK